MNTDRAISLAAIADLKTWKSVSACIYVNPWPIISVSVLICEDRRLFRFQRIVYPLRVNISARDLRAFVSPWTSFMEPGFSGMASIQSTRPF